MRANPTVLDPTTKPTPYRCFEGWPSIALPTKLLDAPVPAVPLLSEGLGGVPDSHLHPPQDLRTLASWLFLADGLAAKSDVNANTQWLRTCPSSGGLYPYEIYVAAFSVDGLEPRAVSLQCQGLRPDPATRGQIALSTIVSAGGRT